MTLDPKGIEAAAKAAFAKANEGNLKPETIESLWPSQHLPHWQGLAEAAITAYLAASQEPAPVAMEPLDYDLIDIPTDVREFGERHNIPEFGNATYRNGYVDGYRFAVNSIRLATPVPPVVGEDAVERAVRAWAYEEYYLAGGGVGSWHEKLSFNKPKDGRLDIRSIAPLYVAPPEGGVAQDLLAAIKQLMPSNLGSLPATMPDSATLPLDVTFGELRQAIAAIAKAEGRSDA